MIQHDDGIDTVLVCGAGTMGTGIAQTAALAGYTVTLSDINGPALVQAKETLEYHLSRMVEKNKLSEQQKKDATARLHYVTGFENISADLVIEAIVEKTDAKLALFNQLASILSPETIFASNTSSLSLTTIAEGIPFPERFIGLHFFNPAPLMKLVEIVHTSHTSAHTRTLVDAFALRCGKTAVHCKDSPGFLVNRVARPYYIESLRLVEETDLSPAQMDLLLENAGFRMGPFRLMDLVGNDVNLAVSKSVFEQLGNPPRLRPSQLQEEKVANGMLGRKTGAGFYDYNGKDNQ